MGQEFESAGRVAVAVGLIQDGQGRTLMASRPADKVYAGWWEFPGGKLETAETPESCLVRELKEELGLVVRSSQPAWVADYDYAHARVRLHFCLVLDWTGEPRGLEGQQFCWVGCGVAAPYPVLPASRPVLDRLRAPR